ncbi:hypothetical protein FACS1894217_04270 [Clostridia bacterium]|nr:hypothetical protein FACS1894217_04270 [Clostridia bacterium]
MSFEEKKTTANLTHHIIMESRAKLTVSGVEDVESFDETGVTMLTVSGLLVVRGADLRIDRLSIDKGEVNVEGVIDSLQYAEEPKTGGFWSRVFR